MITLVLVVLLTSFVVLPEVSKDKFVSVEDGYENRLSLYYDSADDM